MYNIIHQKLPSPSPPTFIDRSNTFTIKCINKSLVYKISKYIACFKLLAVSNFNQGMVMFKFRDINEKDMLRNTTHHTLTKLCNFNRPWKCTPYM